MVKFSGQNINPWLSLSAASNCYYCHLMHRNWLAITHSKPLSEWYTESTSEWTLDYPPLFAWLEYGFSQMAPFFDVKMLKISSKAYESEATILFQRLTVIIMDLFYVYGALQWLSILSDGVKLKTPSNVDYWFHPYLAILLMFLLNPGLLMVDHIHFQYNGFLSGVFLLSMARMVQKSELESAFWFAVLLNMKHIYLYVAPAYFVYLLRHYCFDINSRFAVKKFLKLGLVVGGVFAFSFGPFIAMGQLEKVIRRLFPFKRGLTHAYWAPNFWAVYNTADKGLSIALGQKNESAAMTGGLVQEYNHQVLPNITPFMTMIIVFLSMIPCLHYLWLRASVKLKDSSLMFVRSVAICAFCSFLFGWHVHEKAILLVTIPLTPLAFVTSTEGNLFAFLSLVSSVSLFPLLHNPAETPTKIILTAMYCMYCYQFLSLFPKRKGKDTSVFSGIEKCYLIGLVLTQIFYSFGSSVLPITPKLPFLPLLITSLYCSLGVIYSWFKLYKLFVKI
ncbi:putative dolichyl pyrophosphate Glc1Man9GlcNAc2 alpha-1:3-glucosyltransferase-like protein, partial [Leptotrombidium deliense]